MDRRTFLGAALVLVPGAVAAAPVRRQPVVLWSHFNGTLPPGYSALRLVPLVVYADGTAIADAAFSTALGRSAAASLARAVAGALRRPGRPPHDPPVGGPTTRVEAWVNDHHVAGAVAVPPARLVDRRDWTLAHGTAYAPDAVRLIVVVAPDAPAAAPAWPAE